MTVATAWQQVVVDFEAFLLPSSTLLKSHDTYCKHLNLYTKEEIISSLIGSSQGIFLRGKGGILPPLS